MGDTELYGWEKVCAFLAVWLEQLEHSRVTWEDDEAKLKYRWPLVWHPAMTTTALTTMAAHPSQKKQPHGNQAYNVQAKPRSNACPLIREPALMLLPTLKSSTSVLIVWGQLTGFTPTKNATAEGTSTH